MKKTKEHRKKISDSLIKKNNLQSRIYKYCKRCNEMKNVFDFRTRYNANKHGVKYLHSLCRPCEKSYNVERQQKHVLRHPELKEKRQEYNRKTQFARKYGITIDEYNLFLKKQKGVCKICKKFQIPKNRKYLFVDHCHNKNEVRGLLCNKCNSMLGFANDDVIILKSAIKYLK